DAPPGAEYPVEGRQHRRGQQRHDHGQGGQLVHPGQLVHHGQVVHDRPQPLSWTSSCGSRVPNRLCAWTAKASSSAVTAASTTTSVSVSACTTGSTAGVFQG